MRLVLSLRLVLSYSLRKMHNDRKKEAYFPERGRKSISSIAFQFKNNFLWKLLLKCEDNILKPFKKDFLNKKIALNILEKKVSSEPMQCVSVAKWWMFKKKMVFSNQSNVFSFLPVFLWRTESEAVSLLCKPGATHKSKTTRHMKHTATLKATLFCKDCIRQMWTVL